LLKHSRSFYPYILAQSSRTCPLIFLNHSGSFYPYILAHSSGTCPLIILMHSHSFYPYIVAHYSGTCPLIFLKHSGSFYPYIVAHSIHIWWLFYPYIVAHSIRIYSPILVIHVHSLFSSVLAHSINNISAISWRSVLLVEETAIHWQTLSLNVVSLAISGIRTHNISGDRQNILGNTNCNSSKSEAIGTVVFSMYYTYIIFGVWVCKYNIIYLWIGSTR